MLRQRGDWTPLIFLTARDSEDDRVLGIEIGADDYLTKPFSPRELTARLRALLRRAETAGPQAHSSPSSPITVGSVSLDPDRRRVELSGRDLGVTPKEFDLLAHLMTRQGRVVSRDALLEQVWGPDSEAGPRTVDVHVAQLRAKGVDIIRTVRGSGYTAEAPR